MRLYEVESIRRNYLRRNHQYSMEYWKDFDYGILKNVMWYKEKGYRKGSWNDIYIGLDTESSKDPDRPQGNNIPWKTYISAWTISIRFLDMNIVTLYGGKPSDCMKCIRNILEHLSGDQTMIYIHNLAWDWQFLRKFFFEEFGNPTDQLNIKPHYPISIKFEEGLILRDSYIISQVGLEKWAKDLNVEHKKAVGSWDYDKVRMQEDIRKLSSEELHYIENDTLALVECLNQYGKFLKRRVWELPFTATGIVRKDVRDIGNDNSARQAFKNQCPSYQVYEILEAMFHGGYTHANRYIVNQILKMVRCYDFKSSYPFVMLTEKFPAGKFMDIGGKISVWDILKHKDDTAFIFKLILIGVKLKDPTYPMPYLQRSKCSSVINPMVDNGRIIMADCIEIYTNEVDASIIMEQYSAEMQLCMEVKRTDKRYLPRWFTDYVFQRFINKCELEAAGKKKTIDYAIEKGRLNSTFGLLVMKYIRDQIEEDYDTGEFREAELDREDSFNTYIKKVTTILPYQWGVWITSYAARNLFTFATQCIDDLSDWAYSDTDSCYSSSWNYEKVYLYNESCKEKLRANGYGPAVVGDKEYWLGIAETDGKDDLCEEFVTVGAKRYCKRAASDHELHITVSGVPKAGAKSLKNDIRNFKKGMIFKGTDSGKKLHTYFYEKDIYTDQCGNERGDSIDLNPCDYELDDIFTINTNIFDLMEGVAINVFNENDFME